MPLRKRFQRDTSMKSKTGRDGEEHIKALHFDF